MKKIIGTIATSVLLGIFTAFTTPVAAADSSIKLIMDGDTYYLSTTENAATKSGTYKVVAVDEAKTATASTTSAGTPGRVVLPTGYSPTIGHLISSVLRIVIVVAVLLVLLEFIMGGIGWITSGGDKGKTEAARNRIVAALVGILVLSAAYALTLLVAYVLGFDSIDDVFGSIKRINL